MSKYKSILWKISVIVALVNIALWDILSVAMFQVHITPDIQLKKSIIIVSFFCAVILRIIKSYSILFPLIIVSDLILICIAILESGFIENSFLKTLENLISTPVSLLILISIIVFIFDWRIRYKKIQTVQI